MNSLITRVKSANAGDIKDIIAGIEQAVDQLITECNVANQYATDSLALRSYPGYEDLFGDSIDQFRSAAFLWRETIKPGIMHSITKMRSFCTTYTNYFKDITQGIDSNVAVEEYKERLSAFLEELLPLLKKVTDNFNPLMTSVQTLMSMIEANKKNLDERLLPNLEKNVEQIEAKWEKNFKNLKAIIAELEGLPDPNAKALTVALSENTPALMDKKESFTKLLALVKEAIALKSKLDNSQSMKQAFQKLTPRFLLTDRVRNLYESWGQYEQAVTNAQEALAQIHMTPAVDNANEKVALEVLAASPTRKETSETNGAFTAVLQAIYAFLENMNRELESLGAKLKHYELTSFV